MYTKSPRALIALAIIVAILACSGPGQPPPTSRPVPLPAPIDGAEVVELSTDIHMTDVFGDDAVGFDQDGELWLINIRTGDSRHSSPTMGIRNGVLLCPPTMSPGSTNAE